MRATLTKIFWKAKGIAWDFAERILGVGMELFIIWLFVLFTNWLTGMGLSYDEILFIAMIVTVARGN